MGLITKTYGIANTIIEREYVVLGDSRVKTNNSSSSTFEDTQSFDTTLYNMFNQVQFMKDLEYPERTRTEFDLFIQEAEKFTNGETTAAFFNELNEYMGTIGVTETIK